jgi:hypothetical protein
VNLIFAQNQSIKDLFPVNSFDLKIAHNLPQTNDQRPIASDLRVPQKVAGCLPCVVIGGLAALAVMHVGFALVTNDLYKDREKLKAELNRDTQLRQLAGWLMKGNPQAQLSDREIHLFGLTLKSLRSKLPEKVVNDVTKAAVRAHSLASQNNLTPDQIKRLNEISELLRIELKSSNPNAAKISAFAKEIDQISSGKGGNGNGINTGGSNNCKEIPELDSNTPDDFNSSIKSIRYASLHKLLQRVGLRDGQRVFSYNSTGSTSLQVDVIKSHIKVTYFKNDLFKLEWIGKLKGNLTICKMDQKDKENLIKILSEIEKFIQRGDLLNQSPDKNPSLWIVRRLIKILNPL